MPRSPYDELFALSVWPQSASGANTGPYLSAAPCAAVSVMEPRPAGPPRPPLLPFSAAESLAERVQAVGHVEAGDRLHRWQLPSPACPCRAVAERGGRDPGQQLGDSCTGGMKLKPAIT